MTGCTTANQKKERDRKILDLYLRCWTQERIAGEVGVDRDTVGGILKHLRKNSTDGKIPHTFSPYLYNIWNQAKQDKETSP